MTKRLQPCNCPKCDMLLDGATDMSDPNNRLKFIPGDVTLCLYCDALLEFDKDMMFKEINIKELEPEVQDVIVMMLIQAQTKREQRTLH